MSALSTSTSSLHRDNRSESRSYKRDKEHSAKWAMGMRNMPGSKTRPEKVEMLNAETESVWDHEDLPKSRPEKRWSERYHGFKSHANVATTSNSNRTEIFGRAAGRVSRKQNALREVSSPISLTSSFLESIPSGISGHRAPTTSLDAGVMYSYDVKTSPQKLVGLEGLVEKAEEAFNSRETARIVRDEYEILDTNGETVKKGKKGSPKQVAQLVVDDDDEWERL